MLLDEIGAFLTAQGLVDGVTWTLAKGWMPPTPDQIVAVFEAPGDAPFAGRIDADRPAFQIRVRAAVEDYSLARAKLEAVQAALHGHTGTLSGTYYVQILASGSPMSIGRDENKRPELVQNYSAMRSR